MRSVAVTGRFCSGKTSVCNAFSFRNVPVFSCDEEIRKIAKREDVVNEVKSAGIDTNRLALLRDAAAMATLERIYYPRLFAEMDLFAKQAAPLLVYEVPLLRERALENRFDVSILVTAPLTVRRARAMQRGFTQEEFELLESKQSDDKPRGKYLEISADNASKVDEIVRKLCRE